MQHPPGRPGRRVTHGVPSPARSPALHCNRPLGAGAQTCPAQWIGWSTFWRAPASTGRRGWPSLALMRALYFIITAATLGSLGMVLPALVHDLSWCWTGAGFGFTWPAKFPVVRIDQILVRGVEPESSWVLPANGSDHLPVTARISW